MFTQDYLKTIFDYELETGQLIWRYRENVPKQWNTRYAGKVAGCLNEFGYMSVTVNGSYQLVHRLIWLYVHGKWPGEELDHVNGDKADNRIVNLREATRSQNMANLEAPGLGTWRRGNRYRAQITVNGSKIYLGWFSTEEEANQAYLEAKDRYAGEFSYYNRGA